MPKEAGGPKEIERELQESRFGLVCVNPLNMERPWLVFEAGALSNSLGRGRVCPFLLGMQRADLGGPLAQFQNTVFDREDCWKLIGSLNECCDDAALDKARLQEAFDMWWPRLEEELGQLKEGTVNKAQAEGREIAERTKREVLEELLELTRAQMRILDAQGISSAREMLLAGITRESSGALASVGFDSLRREMDDLLHTMRMCVDDESVAWSYVAEPLTKFCGLMRDLSIHIRLDSSLTRLFIKASDEMEELFYIRNDLRRKRKGSPGEEVSIAEASVTESE